MTLDNLKKFARQELKALRTLVSAAAAVSLEYADLIARALSDNLPGLQPYLSPAVVQYIGMGIIAVNVVRGMRKHQTAQAEQAAQ